MRTTAPRDHEQSCFEIPIKKQEKRPTALALLIHSATRQRRAVSSLIDAVDDHDARVCAVQS